MECLNARRASAMAELRNLRVVAVRATLRVWTCARIPRAALPLSLPSLLLPCLLLPCLLLAFVMVLAGATAAAAPHGTPLPSETPEPKVIYGVDDRHDLYAETDPVLRTLAGAVCGLFYDTDVLNNGDGTYTLLTADFLVASRPACPGEPYGNQPTGPYCTGFLVGPDLVATAGHCFDSFDLGRTHFVFDFAMLNPTDLQLRVPASRVYTGAEVVGRVLAGSLDYAVIRLDREVTAPGALPLLLRRGGKIADDAAVGVMGHPSGLPLKVAFGTNTKVRHNTDTDFFVANLDTYGGNSGSPVFNALNDLVEGILVRGEEDFIVSATCFSSNHLLNEEGGEDATRITLISGLVPPVSGFVSFDRDVYRDGNTIQFILVDESLPPSPVSLQVSTGAGDVETVSLTSESYYYRGTLQIAPGNPAVATGNALLEGAPLDVIHAVYANGIASATALLDCVPPVISNVHMDHVLPDQFTVAFETDEPATALLSAGLTCGATGFAMAGPESTMHSLTLEGLDACTNYRYRIQAVDKAGNSVLDNNHGVCYTGRTLFYSGVLLEDHFDPAADANWSHAAALGEDRWLVQSSANAHSGARVFGYEPRVSTEADARLVSPIFDCSGELIFWHTYALEEGYDGAVVEITVDSGQNWFDLEPYMITGRYNGVLSDHTGNTIGGRRAWTGGALGAMEEVRVDLAPLAHFNKAQIRFRWCSDTTVISDGWFIDDVLIQNTDTCIDLSAVPGWRQYE